MQRLFLCIFFLIGFLVLSMSSGVISGAITSQYLLEKSRIVFQVTHTDKQKDPTCIYYFFIESVKRVFSVRPKMKGIITSSMKCWQVFPRNRNRLSIYKRPRPTITSTR